MGGSSGSSKTYFYANESQSGKNEVGEQHQEAVCEYFGEASGKINTTGIFEPVADTIVVLVENLPDGLLMLGEYLFLFVYHLMTAGC